MQTSATRRSRELLDTRTLGPVADEEQRRVLERRDRFDCLLERVKAAKAPGPTDDEAITYAETRSGRVTIGNGAIGAGPEEIEVDPGRRDHDAPRFDTHARHLGGDRLEPHATTSAERNGTCSPVRSVQRSQPGRRTPHCRACHRSGVGTNTTDGTPSAREAWSRGVEQLVALPHARDLVAAPGTRRIDGERVRAPPVAGIFDRGLRDHGHAAAAACARRGHASPGTTAARRRSSPVSITPPGVTIQTSPSSRCRPLAHPAVLTQAATGPCCPAVTVGRTRIAPRAPMVRATVLPAPEPGVDR